MPISQINNNSLASGVPGYANLPAGSVLQVVCMVTGTRVSTTLSDTDVATGVTLSITPKFSTSKILVLVSQNGIARTGSGYFRSWLQRNGSKILRIDGSSGYTGGSGTSYLTGSSTSYLDSPSTTSSITYSTVMQMGSSGSVTLNEDGAVSTITLLEIAA